MSNRNTQVQQPDITLQDVMQMETFRHFTEEQAAELLQFFDTFCDIAYSIWSKQSRKPETQVIELTPTHQIKAA